MYDFDEIIDRRGTRCDKVDSLKDMFGRSDLIPMWVADMDFRTPDFIIDALRRRLDHPILGYPLTGSDYFRIVSDWVYSLHGWRVDPSAFRFIPGIVKGLILAEHCLLPVDSMFAGSPIVLIKDERTEKALRNGMAVKLDAGFEGECRVYSKNREFLLFGAVKDGVLHTIKSFFEV